MSSKTQLTKPDMSKSLVIRSVDSMWDWISKQSLDSLPELYETEQASKLQGSESFFDGQRTEGIRDKSTGKLRGSDNLSRKPRGVEHAEDESTRERVGVWRSPDNETVKKELDIKEPLKKGFIGLVPTMGALHEGHLSLIKQAAEECEHVVVSIFVNPLQFGPHEDFDRYPRSFEKDVQMCEEAGVSVVFHPTVEELYKNGRISTTKVLPPPELVERLCGLFRPGHFVGVATVVSKLFSITLPDKAYFGEKDYQQLVIVKQMVKDLNLPVDIVPLPIVREEDGVARSSRNEYLTEKERKLAPELYATLCTIKEQVLSGVPIKEALQAGSDHINKMPQYTLQYLEACDTETLAPLKRAKTPMVVLIAAQLGNVRLIDNIII